MHALPARPLKVQGGRGCSPCADGMERVYFGLVQIALFTNKKLRQEIRGFPALYFASLNFSAPYTKAFTSLNFSAPYTKAFASLNFSTPYTKAFASLNFSTPYTKVSFAYFSFLVLFNDEKYQKSFKRIFHPLKNLLPSPHGDSCEQNAPTVQL